MLQLQTVSHLSLNSKCLSGDRKLPYAVVLVHDNIRLLGYVVRLVSEISHNHISAFDIFFVQSNHSFLRVVSGIIDPDHDLLNKCYHVRYSRS